MSGSGVKREFHICISTQKAACRSGPDQPSLFRLALCWLSEQPCCRKLSQHACI